MNTENIQNEIDCFQVIKKHVFKSVNDYKTYEWYWDN